MRSLRTAVLCDYKGFLFKNGRVAYNAPVQAVNHRCKITGLQVFRILRLAAGNTKPDYISKSIIVNVITNYAEFFIKMFNVQIIGCHTILPPRNIVKTVPIAVTFYIYFPCIFIRSVVLERYSIFSKRCVMFTVICIYYYLLEIISQKILTAPIYKIKRCSLPVFFNNTLH